MLTKKVLYLTTVKSIIPYIKYTIVSYLKCMMIGTYICSARAQRYVPHFDNDHITVLGCSIRKDGTVTPLLKGRTDRAIWFAKKQMEKTRKDIKFVANINNEKKRHLEKLVAIFLLFLVLLIISYKFMIL